MTTGIYKTTAGAMCVTNKPTSPRKAVIGGLISNMHVLDGCLAVNTGGTASAPVILENRRTDIQVDDSGNVIVTTEET